MTDDEREAIEFGKNWRKVQNRIKNALHDLNDYTQVHFVGYSWDEERRMMISGDKKFALEWRVRERPNREIVVHNQQTSTGVVVLVVYDE